MAVGENVKVVDYHIFEDASQDASILHSNLEEANSTVLAAKSEICSPDVFLGEIADSCESALVTLLDRMELATENFSTISSYFEDVSKEYQKKDKMAFKIIAFGDDGKLFVSDINPNCTFDSKTGWCWPLGKGIQWAITSVNNSGHHGIDIATLNHLVGMDVYCAKSGTVLASGWDSSGYGNWVKIQHDDGTIAIYGHFNNDVPVVSVGQRVEAGEAIGQLGSSGNSSGPHLHFELRGKGGVGYLDPFTFFPELYAYLFKA